MCLQNPLARESFCKNSGLGREVTFNVTRGEIDRFLRFYHVQCYL